VQYCLFQIAEKVPERVWKGSASSGEWTCTNRRVRFICHVTVSTVSFFSVLK